MCERERVWCVCVRERECVCVCVSVRERVCVCERERERKCVCVRESVCVFSCGSVVEHCVSSAKGRGFNSQGTHILTKNV